MKMIHRLPQNLLTRKRREEPDVFGRVTAAMAILAWLVLAGDAFAQGTNQWAPTDTPQAKAAPASGQVWNSGTGGQAGTVYAPADLDQQLVNGTLKAPVAPVAAPTAAPQQPVYAPAGTATSRLGAPAQAYGGQPMAPSAPMVRGNAPVYAPPQGYTPQAYPAQPYGYGQPYGQPYGMPGFGYPYSGAQGYPGAVGSGFFPGITPSPGGWGSPYNGPSGFNGVPFFGGSPFGFW